MLSPVTSLARPTKPFEPLHRDVSSAGQDNIMPDPHWKLGVVLARWIASRTSNWQCNTVIP